MDLRPWRNENHDYILQRQDYNQNGTLNELVDHFLTSGRSAGERGRSNTRLYRGRWQSFMAAGPATFARIAATGGET